MQAFSGCTGELTVNCNIPSIVLTDYDHSAFYDSKFTKVIIGDSVKSIGIYAFPGCSSITSVTIGNNVRKIDDAAFIACISLTSVTIPASVEEIGDYAFAGCSSLKEVYCKPAYPPKAGSSMFYTNASDRKIYVPSDRVTHYKSANYWKDYADNIVGYNF
jgi:hypothetical protein